ncbi:hypothetical protein GCM10027456_68350 [Kineosporia babensis]|uniref:Uncharacterized protein n=1 Tax=Kineosporia babensis TaxID=499548 RepID=A0A9X1SWL5_9ACTN|nr:hypothetical protein [Kineosporia babensis]
MNAAYLAGLVGSGGLVVTIDIDGDVTARARRCLAAAGYDQVRVVTGDAPFGAPAFAPCDGILVTVETTDAPAAWWDQPSAASGSWPDPLAGSAPQRHPRTPGT